GSASARQQLQNGPFDLLPVSLPAGVETPGIDRDRAAGPVAIEHARIDVGVARDRGGVAQRRRHDLDGGFDLALAARLGRCPRGCALLAVPTVARAGERGGGDHGRVPRAEVLGAELLAEHGLEVVVDLVGADRVPAAAIAVREQLWTAAAPALELIQQSCGAPVVDDLHAFDAALGRIVEAQQGVVDRHVLFMQGRQAEAAVVLRVDLVADAEEPEVQEPDGAGEDAHAGGLLAAQVAQDAAAQPRLILAEAQHPVELLPAPALVPERVIEVLLATGVVDSGRLQMAEVVGADPHVLPGRRDREPADSLQQQLVVDALPIGIAVDEAATATDAGDPRSGAIGSAQARHAGGLRGRALRRAGR